MSMITTTHTQEIPQRKPHTERAMAQLRTELLGLERGEEPNHERIQRALLELSDRPPSRRAAAVRGLCDRLCMYMREIRQDEMELSVEDLDVLLDSWAQLEVLVLGQQLPLSMADAVEPVEPTSPHHLQDIVSAPEFRDSGLLVENHRDKVRIILPPMNDSRVTAKVLADISELWELTPETTSWSIELGRLDRVPVSLLSLLVGLNRDRADRVRAVNLSGLNRIVSPQLSECLHRCFGLPV